MSVSRKKCSLAAGATCAGEYNAKPCGTPKEHVAGLKYMLNVVYP
jgi:hypothetical protein